MSSASRLRFVLRYTITTGDRPRPFREMLRIPDLARPTPGLALLTADTEISESGLQHLRDLTQVVSRFLRAESITDRGRAVLKTALPKRNWRKCRTRYLGLEPGTGRSPGRRSHSMWKRFPTPGVTPASLLVSGATSHVPQLDGVIVTPAGQHFAVG